ncbi:hypothetical protein [Deinococcus roseus]|uniref:Lipoprotein n=1 Tax=Deinococcus roseus TaxID=392414 RepID=A0ABQ2D7Q0_9DEIO|nr:hypothetical protein [Deinococcus roseus]GGJ47919.1 hypothetical protein GCM10008938_37410 [Deinococcus roseus]
MKTTTAPLLFGAILTTLVSCGSVVPSTKATITNRTANGAVQTFTVPLDSKATTGLTGVTLYILQPAGHAPLLVTGTLNPGKTQVTFDLTHTNPEATIEAVKDYGKPTSGTWEVQCSGNLNSNLSDFKGNFGVTFMLNYGDAAKPAAIQKTTLKEQGEARNTASMQSVQLAYSHTAGRILGKQSCTYKTSVSTNTLNYDIDTQLAQGWNQLNINGDITTTVVGSSVTIDQSFSMTDSRDLGTLQLSLLQ